MTNRILLSSLFLLPLLASADTLIMKDGSALRGTFNNANTTRISFTEFSGNRRDVSVNDVQELRFGNDQQQQQQPYSSSNQYPGDSRNSGNPNNPNYGAPGPNPAMGEDLERLRQDLRTAIDNNNWPSEQRQVLEDARETLRNASQQGRNGRPMNSRNVRLALDSIRNAADRMQRQDRERLNDDIRRVNASMGGQQGRDY